MPNGFPEGDFRIINQDTNARLFTYDRGYSRESIEAKSSTTNASGNIDINIARNPGFGVGFPGNNYDDLWFINTDKDRWGHPQGDHLVSHLKVTNGRFALQVQRVPYDPPEINFFRVILNFQFLIFPTPLKDIPSRFEVEDDRLDLSPENLAKGIQLLFPEKVLSHSSEELSRLCLADLVREASSELSHISSSDQPTEDLIDSVIEELKRALEEYTPISTMLTLWGRGREGLSEWQAEDGYIFLEGQPEQVLTLVNNGKFYGVTLADRGASNQTWRFK